MKELKKHLSIPDQVTLMESRGLTIVDKNLAQKTLFSINYYRLSGYLHDFKEDSSDQYVSGLSWERLKRIHDFDRKLSRILMYALEDIEETLKTRLSYIITSHHPDDPLIYLKPMIYRDYKPYLRFLNYFYQEVENNKKLPFVKHHLKEYDGRLPMWVAVELFTMGNLHGLYDNLSGMYQKEIAKAYCTGPRQLASWIENLTYTRNHLAHYMRVYNFNFGRTPIICKNHPRLFSPSNKIFDQIFVISCLYSDKDEWNNYVLMEIKALIDEYREDIELSGLGFPANWDVILLRT